MIITILLLTEEIRFLVDFIQPVMMKGLLLCQTFTFVTYFTCIPIKYQFLCFIVTSNEQHS